MAVSFEGDASNQDETVNLTTDQDSPNSDYGATTEVDVDEEKDGFDGQSSFVNGKPKIAMHTLNLFQSKRIAASFREEEVELAPTLLTHNVALVTDPNLTQGERGRFFYSLNSFYNTEASPEYALTVGDNIYQRIIQEVSGAKEVPCGLYFCCHGGDGAHTGISHDDFVDIRLAWSAIGIVFVIMFGIALAYR